ncbi:hypothetical protein BJ742DRAFT_662971, partial [Cladochytrium replicatum]
VAIKFMEKAKIRPRLMLPHPTYGKIPSEAEALSSFDHPNIGKFIELFDDPNYFIM